MTTESATQTITLPRIKIESASEHSLYEGRHRAKEQEKAKERRRMTRILCSPAMQMTAMCVCFGIAYATGDIRAFGATLVTVVTSLISLAVGD